MEIGDQWGRSLEELWVPDPSVEAQLDQVSRLGSVQWEGQQPPAVEASPVCSTL